MKSGYSIRELSPNSWALVYEGQVEIDEMTKGFAEKVLDAVEGAERRMEGALTEAERELEDANLEHDELQSRLDTMSRWFEDADPAGAMKRELEEATAALQDLPELSRDAESWRRHVTKLEAARRKRNQDKEAKRLIMSIQQRARKEGSEVHVVSQVRP